MRQPLYNGCFFQNRMEKVVLILGNGFDLDLGLKTSYKDFIDSGAIEDKKHFSTDTLFQAIYDKYKEKKWIDIEEELKNYAVQQSRKSPLLREPLGSYIDLRNRLLTYIKSINYSALNKNSIALRLLKSIVKYTANNYVILDFNYTDLEQIGKQIGLENFSYRHVHGTAKDDSIVFGFDDEVEVLDDYCSMIKSHSEHYRSVNINDTLLHAEEIIFFGHSLGSTDYHYFSEFFLTQVGELKEKYNRKVIRIFTYDENARLNILLQLRNMNHKKTTLLYDLNDFRIYRTAPEYVKDRAEMEVYCDSFERKMRREREAIEELQNMARI